MGAVSLKFPPAATVDQANTADVDRLLADGDFAAVHEVAKLLNLSPDAAFRLLITMDS